MAKLLAVPFYFCMVNVAALVAVANLLRGRRVELWKPQRDAAAPDVGLTPPAVEVQP
jgi:hypothetical protein